MNAAANDLEAGFKSVVALSCHRFQAMAHQRTWRGRRARVWRRAQRLTLVSKIHHPLISTVDGFGFCRPNVAMTVTSSARDFCLVSPFNDSQMLFASKNRCSWSSL